MQSEVILGKNAATTMKRQIGVLKTLDKTDTYQPHRKAIRYAIKMMDLISNGTVICLKK